MPLRIFAKDKSINLPDIIIPPGDQLVVESYYPGDQSPDTINILTSTAMGGTIQNYSVNHGNEQSLQIHQQTVVDLNEALSSTNLKMDFPILQQNGDEITYLTGSIKPKDIRTGTKNDRGMGLFEKFWDKEGQEFYIVAEKALTHE